MFDAQLLFGETAVYSPWFAREGDSALFTLDVVAISGGDITVKVFTKNREDTGDGANANVSTQISRSTAGRTTQEWTSTASVGLKEFVRYRIQFDTDFVPPGDLAWVLFRMLSPVWFDAV